MTVDTTIHMAEFVTGLLILATLFSVAVTAIQFRKQMRTSGLQFGKQLNSNVFIEYVKRYEALIEELYKETKIDDLESDAFKDNPHLSHLALKYLNLCSEEFYLWHNGYLSGDLWNIWEHDIKANLTSPLFDKEWEKLKGRFDSYSRFSKWVEDVRRHEHKHSTKMSIAAS